MKWSFIFLLVAIPVSIVVSFILRFLRLFA
jgi:hypothetical protein